MADYRLLADRRKTGRWQDDVALLFQAGGRDVAEVIDREQMEPMAGIAQPRSPKAPQNQMPMASLMP